MPALPVIPGVIRVQLKWKISEDLGALNRWFYSYTGTAPTTAQLNTMAATVNAAVGTYLAGLYHAQTTMEEVIITDMATATGAVGTASTPRVGTRSGYPNIASAAVLSSGEIGRRYRGGHPRIYFPFGVAQDLNDDQTWGSAFITTVGTDLASFQSAITGAVWTGGGSLTNVNVSQYAGFTTHTGTTGRERNVSTPRTSPVIDAIISTVVRIGVAVIRKRLLSLA